MMQARTLTPWNNSFQNSDVLTWQLWINLLNHVFFKVLWHFTSNVDKDTSFTGRNLIDKHWTRISQHEFSMVGFILRRILLKRGKKKYIQLLCGWSQYALPIIHWVKQNTKVKHWPYIGKEAKGVSGSERMPIQAKKGNYFYLRKGISAQRKERYLFKKNWTLVSLYREDVWLIICPCILDFKSEWKSRNLCLSV